MVNILSSFLKANITSHAEQLIKESIAQAYTFLEGILIQRDSLSQHSVCTLTAVSDGHSVCQSWWESSEQHL